MKTNRVFLDTNILMNDFLHRFPQFARLSDDVNRLHCANAIQHIRRNRLFKTYIASFSIARLVSLLESLRVPKSIVVQEIERLIAKNNVVNLTSALITNATDLFKNDPLLTDFEDAFQYAVCRNNDCYYLLTLNIKDFRHFQSIVLCILSNIGLWLFNVFRLLSIYNKTALQKVMFARLFSFYAACF